MSDATTPTTFALFDEAAFRAFARMHPHEAAVLNWPRFFKMCCDANPNATETFVRVALKETLEIEEPR